MRFLPLIFSFLTICCNSNKESLSKNENNGDEVYFIDQENKEMNEAIVTAKKTYSDFLSAFQSKDSLNLYYAVKMRFNNVSNGNGEHMWLNNLHYKGNTLFGILDSDPVEVFSVKSGDTLEIKEGLLSDWMYVRENKLVGGYTIKVLYRKMKTEEKIQFSQEMGFDVE